MPINMDAILGKAKAYMNSPAGQKRVRKIKDKVMLGTMRLQSGGNGHTPEEAASKFIEVLQKAIGSSGLSDNAQAAISNLAFTKATRLQDGIYQIGVYFNENLSRPSLNEAKFGGITDLAELFNNGVNHKMRPVEGMWHGDEIWSRTVIPGTHFMEQARDDFLGNYAVEYNVIDFKLNKSWE